MSCGIGRRHGSDLALLWLQQGPAAIAPIGPLTWEPPYALGAALKRQKKKRKMMYVQESILCLTKSITLTLAEIADCQGRHKFNLNFSQSTQLK